MSNPDTSLDPHPTGAAAIFAASHADEHPLKLYGSWFCPFVQRAWIVLHEKSIPHQYIEMNPYHKTPEFLALNPRGLVPTLGVPVDRGGKKLKPLYESLVVCEFLDEAFTNDGAEAGEGNEIEKGSWPSPAERLLPTGAYERARCRLWIDHIATRIIPGFYKLLQHTSRSSYSIDSARDGFLTQIKTFAREMAPAAEGPWFLGQRFSLVDVMLAPWAKRLWLIDYYKPGGVGIPKEGEVDQGKREDHEGKELWKRWTVWLDAITSRKSVKETWSEEARYIEAYKRYAEDTTESQVGKATREGRRLP